jgi:SAM-dependent methyltransferase
MNAPVQHPECDLRSWLEDHGGLASDYTARRINQSYGRLGDVLAECEGVSYNGAFDIGCGPGLDSFALGLHFDRVLAIDPNRDAIGEANRIARKARVRNVRFDCARAEHYEAPETFSFAFCNLMSHNVDSRCLLAVRIAMSLENNGWLYYAEEQEGYPAMEIHRAIKTRNQAVLLERLRQMLRGFMGVAGFRFFASRTMESILSALGLRCTAIRTGAWYGVPLQETLLCVRDGRPLDNQFDGSEPDYLEAPREFLEMRERFTAWAAIRPPEGFNREQRRQIEEEVDKRPGAWTPFFLLLLMADSVLPSLNPNVSSTQSNPDWDSLRTLDDKFIFRMRKNAGLEEKPIDD